MLISFSGLKGSGKDTAAKVLIEEYGFTKIAFADALREALLVLDPQLTIEEEWQPPQHMRLSKIVREYGWDWAKNAIPEVRRLMQVFGTEVGRMLFGENVWVDTLAKRFPDIAEPESRYVITDCRFDNELAFVHANDGTAIWVSRPGVKSDGHASESDAMAGKVDYLLRNETTVEELQEDVRFMLFMRGIEPLDNTEPATR
jgi:deoxynucleotide monophosphate kinase-like protein